MSKEMHDLKNSIVTLRAGLEAFSRFIPELIDTYQVAKSEEIQVTNITDRQLELLLQLSTNLTEEVESVNQKILLLSNQ